MRNYLLLFIVLFLIGCKAESENDASKRNADWVWWVDEHTGKGVWIKSGDHTTVKDGKYTKFYFNGNVYSKGRLKNGVEIDTIFGYDLKGKLDCFDIIITKEQKEFYAIKDGPFLKLFPDGKKAVEGFVRNHKTGEHWREYNKEGILIHETNFMDSPRFTAKYFDNGKLKLKYVGDVHYIDSFHNWDLNNGVKREYYSNGNLETEECYKNGLANGIQTKYFLNGQLEVKVEFKDGEIFGSGFYFYENGHLKKNHKFSNGKENGTCIDYYENGEISAIANFKDGTIDGKLITFDSLGKNQKEYFFKDGVRIR